VHDLVHVDAVAVRQLLKIAISTLKQYPTFTIPPHTIRTVVRIQSLIVPFFSFLMIFNSEIRCQERYTHRVHEHLVLLILLRIQHVIALLAKSDAHESRTVVVRVVTRYLRHNYAPNRSISIGISAGSSNTVSRRENSNNNNTTDELERVAVEPFGAPSVDTLEKLKATSHDEEICFTRSTCTARAQTQFHLMTSRHKYRSVFVTLLNMRER